MKAKEGPPTLCGQAAEVRRIAQGIFDKDERSAVLRFVTQSIKLSKTAPR